MNILFIGDIVGKPGREYITSHLNKIKNDFNIDICIANGENASHGNSLTLNNANELRSAGIDIITMGNHTFNRNVETLFDEFPYAIRPANYSSHLPGNGSIVFDTGAFRLGVVNVQGQVGIEPINSPFEAIVSEIEKISKDCDAIFVDFHAEATSEKLAMGHFLDGKVAAVVGTHTHVQTADEKILPKGTAYITDVGMTGVKNSILGTDITTIVNRFAYQKKDKFILAEGDVQFNGVVVTIDNSNLSKSIRRIML